MVDDNLPTNVSYLPWKEFKTYETKVVSIRISVASATKPRRDTMCAFAGAGADRSWLRTTQQSQQPAAAASPEAAASPVAVSIQDAPAQEAPPIPADQLDSLVAPIALYPDPLLSQVLVASTYPLEIMQLQQWLDKKPESEGQGAGGCGLETTLGCRAFRPWRRCPTW